MGHCQQMRAALFLGLPRDHCHYVLLLGLLSPTLWLLRQAPRSSVSHARPLPARPKSLPSEAFGQGPQPDGGRRGQSRSQERSSDWSLALLWKSGLGPRCQQSPSKRGDHCTKIKPGPTLAHSTLGGMTVPWWGGGLGETALARRPLSP